MRYRDIWACGHGVQDSGWREVTAGRVEHDNSQVDQSANVWFVNGIGFFQLPYWADRWRRSIGRTGDWAAAGRGRETAIFSQLSRFRTDELLKMSILSILSDWFDLS
jgi:hypothetical protein